MVIKDFLEALTDNVRVVINESDNTQIADFQRNSYKALADTLLEREIDSIEIVSKSVISIVLTLKENDV